MNMNSCTLPLYINGIHTILTIFCILSLMLVFRPNNVHGSIHLKEVDIKRPHNVLELTSSNYDEKTREYMIVVLNFYADWCPYSAVWKPIFQQTAKSIYNSTQGTHPANSIIFGQVNCVEQSKLAQRFRVTKYPTTKYTIDGQVVKKEYRGRRNFESFREFIQELLRDPIIYVADYVHLHDKLKEHKGALMLTSTNYGESVENPIENTELKIFRKISRELRDDCQFFFVLNKTDNMAHISDFYKFSFKEPHRGLGSEQAFIGNIQDENASRIWAKDNCVPFVREITFANAEEMTEEGLPFVILFYEPDDKTPIELYKRVVESQLRDESSGVTFLYADGRVFSNPLSHLGKTRKDLPLIAIDSFRHLFLYKEPVESISQPGKLKQFLDDFHSGKLDREFHFGPDVEPTAPDKTSSPIPESAFQKLAPSPYRYSFPRDEL